MIMDSRNPIINFPAGIAVLIHFEFLMSYGIQWAAASLRLKEEYRVFDYTPDSDILSDDLLNSGEAEGTPVLSDGGSKIYFAKHVKSLFEKLNVRCVEYSKKFGISV